MNIGNILEAELALYDRRISKIKAHPDPSKSRANIIFYDMQRDRRAAILQAWKTGKPIVDGINQLGPLFQAMGLQPIDYVGFADRVMHNSDINYCERVTEVGLPDYLCDRVTVYVPMVLDGVLPPPSLTVVSNGGCEAHQNSSMVVASHFNVPVYHIDVHFEEPSEEALQYSMAHLRDLIAFAEAKIPGVKYDEDKLVELQKWDVPFYNYLHQIYEARKNIPCPEAPQDVFRIPQYPGNYPHPEKAVEFVKARCEEVLERVKKGIGGVPEEKLRILWTTASPPPGDSLKILAERGASVVFFQHGHAPRVYGVVYGNIGDEKEFGRKLTPLEEQARLLLGHSWGGLAKRWIRDICHIARDLKVDAILDFEQQGCVMSMGFQKLLDGTVKRELGIPIGRIQGRELGGFGFNLKDFERSLADLLDMWLAGKHHN
ncbi:2-hydroxyacyl-CoA dehydratase [Chloroflexota bacterium]